MRMVYVDYENVQSQGLEGVEYFEEEGRIFVFYSKHAETMKINIVRKLLVSPVEISFIEVKSGTLNALDFQLVATLFLNMEKGHDYYIISKDTGFDPAVHVGTERGYSVRRVCTLNQIIEGDTLGKISDDNEKIPVSETVVSDNSTLSGGAFCDLADSDTGNVSRLHAVITEKCGTQIAEKYLDLIAEGLKKSDNKNQFYQFFRKNLGDAEGGDLYKSIRSKFDDMKEMV